MASAAAAAAAGAAASCCSCSQPPCFGASTRSRKIVGRSGAADRYHRLGWQNQWTRRKQHRTTVAMATPAPSRQGAAPPDSSLLRTDGVPVTQIKYADGQIPINVLPKKFQDRTPWHSLAEMNFGDFLQRTYRGEVAAVTIKENLFGSRNTAKVQLKNGDLHLVHFQDSYDMLPFMNDILAEKQVNVGYHRDMLNLPTIPIPAWVGLLIPLIAVGFPIVAFVNGVRKGASMQDPETIRTFAHSAADSRKDGKTGVTFADVAGAERTLEELKEIVAFLKDPQRFVDVGAAPPRGVLLEGPPGTGKTLIAKAIAGEAGVPFFATPGSEFVQELVGVGAARVRDLFRRAKLNKPCIIFVDEVDSLGGRRMPASSGLGGGAEEREATLNQVLTEIDGFDSTTGVVFIGATNRADLLDPAILRPGRFDRKIKVDLPTLEGRTQILKIHSRNKKLDPALDLADVAKMVPGFSGADLANLMNEAAVSASRRKAESIAMFDMYTAMERVTGGVTRAPLPKELPVTKLIAIHEAGQAVIATVLRLRGADIERVENVSMVPRGDRWSRTVFQRSRDEQYSLMANTLPRMMGRMLVMLAGRATEEAFFGPLSVSTAGLDGLEDATLLARRMIVNYGMSNLGFLPVSETPLYNRTGGDGRVSGTVMSLDGLDDRTGWGSRLKPSQETLEAADRTTTELTKERYDKALELVKANMAAIQAVADVLHDKLVVSGVLLEELVQRNPASRDVPLPELRLALGLPGEAVTGLGNVDAQ